MGTLYIVGTPMATPEDVTLRALRILRQVSFVAVGEPESARRFLAHLGLHPRLILVSGPGESMDEALAALDTGDVALLWEGGPHDPAGALIRAAVARRFPIVPIPGPASPLTALVTSGLPADSFIFLGSLAGDLDPSLPPQIVERHTLVGLEAPGSLAGTLARLHTTLGDRPLVLDGEFAGWPQGRWRGTVGSALTHAAACPPQSACTLVIGPGKARPARWDADRLQAEIQARLDRRQSASEIGRQVAAESGWSKREVYRQVLERQALQRSE